MSEQLLNELSTAARKLPSLAGIAATLSKRRDAEQTYYGAYRNLVRAGLRNRLRGKYRP